MAEQLRSWWIRIHDSEGQGLAEYALILAFIAMIAIAALICMGGQVSASLSNIGKSVQAVAP